MKLISWNVNGLRACIQKGFLDAFDQLDADFFCLQETKLSEGQLELDLPGYHQYWCYAEKKGYSGTAIFTKHTPLSVHYGLDVEELDNEGRLITLEYPEFYLVTCYTPNAQRGLARIDHRLNWDEAFRKYISKLDEKKPVILCGDLNVAHKEIDLKNPASNRGNAGFSDEERDSFQKTLDIGFTDTFRHLHPDRTGAYSWWSYMYNARKNNAGWRIDYFLVSDRMKDAIYQADIHSDILGSDHCPVSVDLGLVCNGGIWSPMSQGRSRQVYPVPKDETTATEKATTASAINAKALVALSLIILVTFSLFLLRPSEDPYPKPVSMSTQELLNQILTDSELSQEILKNSNNLMNLANNNPYLSAFIQKSDAPQALLDVTIDKNSVSCQIPTLLLKYLLFENLTSAQAAQGLTGLYNSAYTFSLFSLDYNNPVETGTTEELIEFLCDNHYMLSALLNEPYHWPCDAMETSYEIYKLLLPYSDVLRELEARPNALGIMRLYAQASQSNNEALSKIISLYENYYISPYYSTLAVTDASHWTEHASTHVGYYYEGNYSYVYSNADSTQLSLNDANFAYFVSIPQSYTIKYTAQELELTMDILQVPGNPPQYDFITARKCYSDSGCTQFIGWLVFGNSQTDSWLDLTLYAQNQQMDLRSITVLTGKPYEYVIMLPIE